jgi:putative restriction endonuclease
MAKAVFTAKRVSNYDDLIEERYHFPAKYLRAAERAVGDWILYYAPRRTTTDDASRDGLQAYFATARVTRVDKDPARPDHYYAYVADFFEFDRPVPYRIGATYRERALRKDDGTANLGKFQWSIRAIPEREYDDIVAAGFAALLDPQVGLVREGDRWDWSSTHGEAERPRVACVGERWFRDRAFTALVRQVYANRCAFTGLQITNGGGRPEVQAAHIRPVASSGPDAVRNGIALSGTVHWMFDRGLMSLEDDGRILLSKRGVPTELRNVLRPDLVAALPSRTEHRPHPAFLRYHRETVFKG